MPWLVNCNLLKMTSAGGVSWPSNWASIARGMCGVGVMVGVLETSGVYVMVGVSEIVGVCEIVGVSVMVEVSVGVMDGGKKL